LPAIARWHKLSGKPAARSSAPSARERGEGERWTVEGGGEGAREEVEVRGQGEGREAKRIKNSK